jgi:SAM-dependent methyltransferase
MVDGAEATYQDPGQIFASCAEPYVHFRPRHASAVVDYLTYQLAAGTSAQPRLLDLGCGPGTLALDLAERGVLVTAVDTSQEMLDAGRGWARRRGVAAAVTWERADAASVDEVLPPRSVDGAVIADAFHWMDRRRVLEALDKVVRPGGCVAVVGYRTPGTPREWWQPLLVKLREKHLGAADLAGPGTAYIRPRAGHEALVRESAFSEVSVLRTDYRRSYSLDELVGVQRTYAYSSAATLGGRQEAFEADLRSTLLALQPDGVFEAVLQAAVIVGRRPGD